MSAHTEIAPLTTLELEVAHVIATSVHLDIDPRDVDPVAPLFGDGLGLDSIDMLEIGLALSKQYGIQLRSDCAGQICASLRALTAHIEQHLLTIRQPLRG
ncbi:MAG: phosphopantetheine-binding protein [Nitrospiraceae bacterium]